MDFPSTFIALFISQQGLVVVHDQLPLFWLLRPCDRTNIRHSQCYSSESDLRGNGTRLSTTTNDTRRKPVQTNISFKVPKPHEGPRALTVESTRM